MRYQSLPLLSFLFGLFNTASSFSLAFIDALPIFVFFVEKFRSDPSFEMGVVVERLIQIVRMMSGDSLIRLPPPKARKSTFLYIDDLRLPHVAHDQHWPTL